jgi:hypothetical protein
MLAKPLLNEIKRFSPAAKTTLVQATLRVPVPPLLRATQQACAGPEF